MRIRVTERLSVPAAEAWLLGFSLPYPSLLRLPPLLLGLAAERPHPPIPQQLSAAASEACIPLAGLLPCAVARAHPLYIIQSHAMLDVNYIQM